MSDKKNIEDILPLTPMQEGMLFHYLKDHQDDCYFEQLCLDITGEIDLNWFKQAWTLVVETNDMLRTQFRWGKAKKPLQVVLKKHPLQFAFHDFSNWNRNENEKKNLVEEIKYNDRKDKFNLDSVPFRITLLKIEEDKYEMMISNHHILYDGWSNGILLKEFFSFYHDLVQQKSPLKPPKHKYKEYISRIQRQDVQKQREYWTRYLSGFDAKSELSIKRKKSKNINNGTGNYKVILSNALRAKLENFVKRYRITPACLFDAAWGIVLQRYKNNPDIILGTTVSGRAASVKGIENMVGLFINTIPLRIQIHGNDGEKIGDFLHRLNNELHQREVYETTSLPEIKECGELEVEEELFDTIVVIENYPLEKVLYEGDERSTFSINSYSIFEMTHYDLTVGIRIFENIAVDFTYKRDLFAWLSIKKLAGHFTNILENIIHHPGQEISTINILSEEEKNTLLYDFNKTGASCPKDKTIHRLFEEQAEQTPDNTALHGCMTARMHGEDGSITYKELNEKSNQLAYLLKERGAQVDTIVGIMIERSIEMIVGILGILKANAAYLPIDPKYPNERIRFMLHDAKAKILVKSSKSFKKSFAAGGAHTILIDDAINKKYFLSRCTPVTSLAYIIYTSGTGGEPKGVMIEHSAVVNRMFWVCRKYHLNERDVVLQATSFIFDVSVCEMFRWIPAGGRLCFLPPGGEKEPAQIVKTIVRNQVTTADFVPSLLSILLEYCRGKNILTRLSGLRWVFTGVEVVGVSLVKRFNETLTKVNRTRLINAYGPTESTVDVTYFDCSDIGNRDGVPIGKPMANVRVYILDKNNNIQPIGVYGELCISGAGLARGYLNRPELTAEKFCLRRPGGRFLKKLPREASGPPRKNFLLERKKGPGKRIYSHMAYRSYRSYISKKIYKTGDLACWLPDGNIRFLGRIDHQVKIRGFRVELGEIESRLLKYEKIKDVVVAAGGREEKYLCAYIVSEEKIDEAILKDKLSTELPGYMVPSYILQLDKIPLTPGGNVDRHVLPEPKLRVTAAGYTAPVNQMEETLVSIWSELLNIPKNAIGTGHNFFKLGGHSLKAMRLISGIYKELHVNVPLGEIFKLPTISQLSGYIGRLAEEKYAAPTMVEKKQYYALSSAQRRLYVLQQMNETTTAYNMFSVWILEGEPDRNRLENTFKKLLERHESLRTSFKMIDQEPVQVVHKETVIGHWSLVIGEDEKSEIEDIIKNFIKPFDLSRAPLLRAGLIEIGKEKYIFMVDMHHIISDGISVEILVEDFMTFYGGKELPLPGLRLTYKDFSGWQERQKQGNAVNPRAEYWIKEFAGGIPVPDLPTDFTRPAIQSFAGSTAAFEIGKKETLKLKALGLETGTTIFVTLFALFNVWLSKMSGREAIVVGIPTAGRRHPELEKIVGMFVNTLALRSEPRGEKTFQRFLLEVKEKTSEAFLHQDYPFEDLVETLPVERTTGRNPVFDIMFVLRDINIQGIRVPGLTLKPYEYENKISKFDLTLQVSESEDMLSCTFEYCTKLFKKETIRRFIQYFKKTVSVVLDKQDVKLLEIEIISQQEKQKILFDFNNTHAGYPACQTIHGLFAKQVEQRPNQVVLRSPEPGAPMSPMSYMSYISITYRELNKKSHQLAHLLKQKGAAPDTIVGIMVERSIEMIIGILGILKAGAAYLPLDPDYPQERIKYMLKDSGARVLVTTGTLAKEVKKNIEIILIDSIEISLHSSSHLLNFSTSHSTGLAYVIYTSGTTGRPKGTLIEQRNVVRLLFNDKFPFDFSSLDIWTMFHSYCFDFSVWEMYGALLYGGILVIIPKIISKDPQRYLEILVKEGVTVLNQTPSVFYNLINEVLNHSNWGKKPGIKYVIFGGEALKPKKLEKWKEKYPGVKLINMFGITETTVHVTYKEISAREIENNISNIGKPIPTLTAYVLDKNLNPLPIGVAGELCVGGKGVARGYLNQPELTFERFINYKLQITNKEAHELHELTRIGTTSNEKFLRGGLNQWVSGSVGQWESSMIGKRIYESPGMIPRPHPETNENQHKRFAQHIGSPRRGAPGRRRQKIYKSGDLVRFLENGDMEYLGRIDHQVKVRGFRIELEEIENQLLTHGKVKEAVVLAGDNNNDKYLCAYIAPKPGETNPIDQAGLRQYLSNRLPGYMVPSYFVQLDKIPLTPNGKVDRKALPAPVIEAGDFYEPPRDEVQRKLVEIWSEILGVEKEKIGINDNFFHLGGHSLKAAVLATRIHKQFNTNVPLTRIFNTPYIHGLAAYVKEAAGNKHIPVKPVEKKEYYPLSPAQRRLYILQQMDAENGIAYNIPSVWQVEGGLDKRKIEGVFHQLARRHEGLRTFFTVVNDEPVQRITEENYKLQITNYKQITNKKERSTTSQYPDPMSRELRAKSYIKNFIRPFNLSQAPLLRVGLINVAQHSYILMMDMHHIITDGLSMKIFVKEFPVFYGGEEPSAMKLQYKDYTMWQNRLSTSGKIKKQEAYWLRQYAGDIPILNLDTDFEREAPREFEGNTIPFTPGIKETEALKKLTLEKGATLYLGVLSIFYVLLSKLTNQEDIVIGTMTSGRRHADLEGIIGMFVNTLALRNYPAGEKTFPEFMDEVKKRTLEAFENQDYQFDELTDKLEIDKSAVRNPLFDVTFGFINNDMILQVDIPGLKIVPYRYESNISKFDISLKGTETQGQVTFEVEYNTKLFKKTAIECFIKCFNQLVSSVIGNPGQKLSEMKILSGIERDKILHRFNDDLEYE